MGKTLLTLYKEPGKDPVVKIIENTLEALQLAVGGFVKKVNIQTVDYKRGIIILCNEEGYLDDLNQNVFGIYGPIVVCRTDGEDFASLRDWEILDLARKDFAK